jgi:hypothetical protein
MTQERHQRTGSETRTTLLGRADRPVNPVASRLAPFWSHQKVSSELGTDGPGLDAAAAAGDVLGLETSDGVVVFPVAQFERVAGRVRVRPGVRSMLHELRNDDQWSVAQLLTAPASELGDTSPYEAVEAGADLRDLVAYARLIHAQWR